MLTRPAWHYAEARESEAEAKMYEAEAETLYSRNINNYIGTNCHK